MNTSKFFNVTRQRAGSGGFALVEVLVALLLFSIGILGLLGLQARSIATAGDAEDRSRAALIADQCVSQMQLLANGVTLTGAAGLAGLCNGWAVDRPQQGGLPGGSITAAVDPATPLAIVPGGSSLVPVTVNITVKWDPASGHGDARPVKSRFVTQVTLLVQNS
jgi:type IV pilus assembly protein PilV